jgi:hypothetical protein
MFVILFTGCLTTNEFNYIERSIKKEISPAKIKTKFKFAFGPISLSTARFIANFTHDGQEASKYLKEIQRVQVGVYEIHETEKSSQLRIPRKVEQKLEKLGWEMFIRVKEKDKHVNLFYKQINKHVSGLYVIVLEADEMVIVEVLGNLEQIIEQAIQEHGFPQRGMIDVS